MGHEDGAEAKEKLFATGNADLQNLELAHELGTNQVDAAIETIRNGSRDKAIRALETVEAHGKSADQECARAGFIRRFGSPN